jgi:hypothetical protein
MEQKLLKSGVRILFCSIILFACTSSPEKMPEFPDIGFLPEQYNTHFIVTAPTMWNTFKIDEGIMVGVEVTGNTPVFFDSDYGAILFILKNDSWVEVANFAKYVDTQYLLVPASGNAFKTGSTSVFPILSNKDEVLILRIILIGNLVENGQPTDVRVAGYVDVKITP